MDKHDREFALVLTGIFLLVGGIFSLIWWLAGPETALACLTAFAEGLESTQ